MASILAVARAATSYADATAFQAGNCASDARPSYTVTVCLTTPSAGSVISGMTPAQATVSVTGANPGVRRLIFYVDNQYALTAFGPVSYTHLDVYKRQDEGNDPGTGNSRVENRVAKLSSARWLDSGLLPPCRGSHRPEWWVSLCDGSDPGRCTACTECAADGLLLHLVRHAILVARQE